MDSKPQKIIDHYRLKLLPDEGVLFTSTYFSTQRTSHQGSIGSAMIGLLCHEPLSISRFHKLDCDEIWHFYAGDPIHLHLLHPDGTYQHKTLGNEVLVGQEPQCLIYAGTWQAAGIDPDAQFALFGCTTTPAFGLELFSPGIKSELLKTYPNYRDLIDAFGCDQEATEPF